MTALKPYWNLLVTYLRPQRRRVATLSALLLVSIALQIANPQLLRFFIDTAQDPQSAPHALLVAALLVHWHRAGNAAAGAWRNLPERKRRLKRHQRPAG